MLNKTYALHVDLAISVWLLMIGCAFLYQPLQDEQRLHTYPARHIQDLLMAILRQQVS